MNVLMRICPQCGLRTERRVCELDGFQTVDEGLLSTSSDPLVGQVFEDRYRVEGILGRGGMGTVYRATQLSVGRSVALKVLNADRVTDLTTIARFQQEARSVATLSHPNTIRLIDFGQTDVGILYLVMEFLEGEPLSSLLKRESPLDPERVIRIGIQVLEGLAEAHSVGIIHRDLKPDNLFVTELFGRPDFMKILDFGIAKVTGFEKGQNLTGVGVALGSPRYMAPEQASAGTVDQRADIYALGVVLYEMLAGKPPFLCGSVAEYMLAHVEYDVPEMVLDGHPLVGRLPDFIYACLSKYPLHRPTDAASALELLRSCAGVPFEPAPQRSVGSGSSTVTETGPARARRPRAKSSMHEAVSVSTAFDEEAAVASAAPVQLMPSGVVGPRTAPSTGHEALRPSETGLSSRGAAPPQTPPASTQAWPVLLAALALLGLGAGATWWALQGDVNSQVEVSQATSVEAVAAPVKDEAPTREAAATSKQAVEDEVPAAAQDVVMLITVPPGATVTRGKAVLGVTPLALVWADDGDRRSLQVRLDGYQRERLKRADVGASGRYELYLRPATAKRAKRKPRQQPEEGAWIERISKPAAPKIELEAPVKTRPSPPPKSTVYEELD
ncbi:MAG: protein kinase domain-containing protein [Myxococcota bacterium]